MRALLLAGCRWLLRVRLLLRGAAWRLLLAGWRLLLGLAAVDVPSLSSFVDHSSFIDLISSKDLVCFFQSGSTSFVRI